MLRKLSVEANTLVSLPRDVEAVAVVIDTSPATQRGGVTHAIFAGRAAAQEASRLLGQWSARWGRRGAKLTLLVGSTAEVLAELGLAKKAKKAKAKAKKTEEAEAEGEAKAPAEGAEVLADEALADL